MTNDRMSRRGVLIGAGVGTAVLGALTVPGGSAFADGNWHGNGNGNENENENTELLGGWLITRSDSSSPTPVQGTLTFAAGGAFASHDINPPSTPFLGTWARTDDDKFSATMWTGTQNPTTMPPTVNTIEVSLKGSFDDEADKISGTYTVTIFDASGTQVGTINDGTFRGSPIDA